MVGSLIGYLHGMQGFLYYCSIGIYEKNRSLHLVAVTRCGCRIGHLRHNTTLHQTPDSYAVPAGAGGGAGELIVEPKTNIKMLDYLTPATFIFFGVVVFLFSRSEKDYQNCIKLHGKEFSDKRKSSLRKGGPILFLLGLFWAFMKFTGVF